MKEEHIACKSPSNPNIKIWRYQDLSKFIDLILNESLYFTRVDIFDDIFEGSLPILSVIARQNQLKKLSSNDTEQKTEFWNKIGIKFKKKYAINCWHMNDFESAAMWKIYLKTNEGIAIQSTYQRLNDCLNKLPKPVYLGIVKYIDYEKDLIDWGNRMVPFFHKRKSFLHEQELRAIIRGFDYDLNNGGIKLPIDLNLLIEKIYVAPYAPKWFNQLIKDIVVGKNITVINSRLDDKPIY